MKFEQVHALLKGVPFIQEDNARKLFNFIQRNNCLRILELGFAHGTASCYMAAALDEIGSGQLDAVDLISASEEFKPGIEEQLGKGKLSHWVKIHRMQSGYNWFLHDVIRENTIDDQCNPIYDLIIIDGPKNWTVDSSSFFLADKLLKPGGWMIWDDMEWTYAQANKKRDATDGVQHQELSKDELNTPHIKEIFELLVMQHPNYSNFDVHAEGDWAWAQKVKGEERAVKVTVNRSLGALLRQGFYRLIRRK